MKSNHQKIPWRPFTAIIIAGLGFTFSTQLISSNLPFITRQYLPDIPDNDIGYYSGFLSSIYYIGNIPGSIFIGWMADHYGRRNIYLSVLISFFICYILFGLSRSYVLSLVIRFLWGFSDGFLGLSKTLVYELCDVSSVSYGFSIFQFGMGIGGMIGPIIGGYMSKLSIYFPSIISCLSFLKDIPYFPSCLFCSVFILISIILTYLYIPDTLTHKHEDDITTKLLSNSKDVLISSEQDKDVIKDIENHQSIQIVNKIQTGKTQCSLLKTKDVFVSIFLYGFLSLCQSIYDSIIPLWLMSPISSHGFEWDQTDISWIFTATGIFQIITNPLLFPYLSVLVTYKNQFIAYLILYTIFFFINPTISYISTDSIWQWLLVSSFCNANMIFRLLLFSTVYIFIANSTDTLHRGQVNGMGQVVGSLFRFFGPSLSSSLFAWTLNNHMNYPFDHSLCFILLSIISLLTIFVTLCLSSTINTPKEDIL